MHNVIVIVIGPKLLPWNFLQSSQLSIRSGAHKRFRRFFDFSQFLTAISQKLWRHLAKSMRTKQSIWKRNPFWKKGWKPRRNRATNGNAMLVQTMHPSGLGAWQKNENIQTPHFRTYSWRSLFDLPKLCTVIVLVKAVKKVPNIFRSNT